MKPAPVTQDRSIARSNSRTGNSTGSTIAWMSIIGLAASLLLGCRSSTSLLAPATVSLNGYATITLEGIPTGGSFRAFCDLPVLSGDKLMQPKVVFVPGDPRRLEQTLKATQSEYLLYDVSKHDTWFAGEAIVGAEGAEASVYSLAANNILYVPKDRWAALSESDIEWFRFEGPRCIPTEANSPGGLRASLHRVVWLNNTSAIGHKHGFEYSLEPPLLITGSDGWIRVESSQAASAFRHSKDAAFAEFKYSDANGRVDFPFINCMSIARWSQLNPEEKIASTPGTLTTWGRLAVDRELSPPEKISLAEAWIARHSFLRAKLSPVGIIASKALTWNTTPGVLSITVLASLGWERGTSVGYVRSTPIQVEAGKHYRFRLVNKVKSMLAHLEIETVLK